MEVIHAVFKEPLLTDHIQKFTTPVIFGRFLSLFTPDRMKS